MMKRLLLILVLCLLSGVARADLIGGSNTGGSTFTPGFMGNNGDTAGAATLVSSTTYFQAWSLYQTCTTKSASFDIGAQASTMSLAIYNSAGNIVLSSGPFTVPAPGSDNVAVPAVTLQPGLYYLAFGFSDSVTASVTRYASSLIGTGTGMYSKSNGMTAAGVPITSLGNPPVFDNASTRSPAVVWNCVGGAP